MLMLRDDKRSNRAFTTFSERMHAGCDYLLGGWNRMAGEEKTIARHSFATCSSPDAKCSNFPSLLSLLFLLHWCSETSEGGGPEVTPVFVIQCPAISFLSPHAHIDLLMIRCCVCSRRI